MRTIEGHEVADPGLGSRRLAFLLRRRRVRHRGRLHLIRAYGTWLLVAILGALGGGNLAMSDAKDPLPQTQTPTLSLEEPFIDVDEWRDAPERHRYVHGGFKGTDAAFSLYLPPRERYEGRFFQPLMAVSGSENTAPMALGQHNSIGFAFASGGYLVESNLGSRNMFIDDRTAQRVSAAVAEYSRKRAVEMYGYEHRPYGYVYGGSGGAFKTLTCVVHSDAWDGAVPFVHGSPVAIPSVFTVQAHAMRVLWDDFPSIVDALEPGGSGDMYAGLDEEEQEALREVTRMGFPPRAWFNFEKIAFGYTGVFSSLVDMILLGDPTYLKDFWSVPGYLGADPPASLARARIHHSTKIDRVLRQEEVRSMGLPLSMSASQRDTGTEFPAALRLADLPDGDLRGASLTLKSGDAKDTTLYVAGVRGDLLLVGFGARAFPTLGGVKAGDAIEIDNSVYLATQTYHRHVIPSADFDVWDQFKGPDGEPLYPQRSRQRPGGVGPDHTATMSGQFNGKMIVVQTLMDEAAYPWQADWYRSKVMEAQGSRIDEKYRLYFVDHAMHTTQTAAPGDPRPVATTRVVSYQGALQQAIRDVSRWVEEGVAPPASTRYEMADGQVVVPSSAAARKGIQPTVRARANGQERADVAVGDEVELTAIIEVPPGAGTVVKAEWDFEGGGDYPVVEEYAGDASRARVEVKASHTFSRPGTYFPAVRVTSQREGDAAAGYARVQNLGRVRVVVE